MASDQYPVPVTLGGVLRAAVAAGAAQATAALAPAAVACIGIYVSSLESGGGTPVNKETCDCSCWDGEGGWPGGAWRACLAWCGAHGAPWCFATLLAALSLPRWSHMCPHRGGTIAHAQVQQLCVERARTLAKPTWRHLSFTTLCRRAAGRFKGRHARGGYKHMYFNIVPNTGWGISLTVAVCKEQRGIQSGVFCAANQPLSSLAEGVARRHSPPGNQRAGTQLHKRCLRLPPTIAPHSPLTPSFTLASQP